MSDEAYGRFKQSVEELQEATKRFERGEISERRLERFKEKKDKMKKEFTDQLHQDTFQTIMVKKKISDIPTARRSRPKTDEEREQRRKESMRKANLKYQQTENYKAYRREYTKRRREKEEEQN